MKSDVKSFYIILIIKIMLMNVLLRTISNGNDYSTTYRILAATRIEIALLETIPLYGQGEKCA